MATKSGITHRIVYNAIAMAEEQPDSQPNLSDLITLKQAAETCRLSYSHLRRLARRGDIWAVRLGHNWFTTAEAVHEYASQVHNPGPKPGKDKQSTSGDV